jgi:translocation and assembly module TamB
MIRRVLTVSLLFIVAALLMSTLISWNFEKVDAFLAKEIQKNIPSELPISVSVGKAFIRLIPLELTIHNVQIEPKAELQKTLDPFSVGAVVIQPSLWNLVFGKVHIASLSISESTLNIKTPPQTQDSNRDIDIFKVLSQIPISKLELQNIKLKISGKIENESITADLNGLQATLIQDKDFLNLNLRIHQLTSKLSNATVIDKSFFETKFILTRKNLVLSDFKLKDSGSFIVASGTSQIDLKKKIFGKGNINIRTEINSDKVQFLYKIITKKEKTPIDKIDTILRGDLRLSLDGKLENSRAQVEAALYNFRYEKFRLGNILAKAHYDGREKKIKVDELRLTNKGVTAFAGSSSLDLDTLEFTPVDVSLNMFHLMDYLEYSLNQKITSDVEAKGKVTCSGTLNNLKISCAGTINAANAVVRTGDGKPIVNVASGNVTGNIDINLKEVTYVASIEALGSKGTSTGSVNYESGFIVNFNSPQLNVTELKNIGKLEVTGSTKVSGSTKGNSKTATFEMVLDAQDFTLNKFQLGSIATQLKYRNGSLFFEKIQGALISSRYLGDLQVDLLKDQMSGKLQFPFVDLAVIQESIKEHLSIPFQLSGSGSAVVNLASPLDINQLGLQAKARLYNCKVDQQHIDNVDIDVVSENGRINLRSVLLEEKSTNIRAGGYILIKEEEFNIQFASNKVFTEDIAYSDGILKKIKGTLKVSGAITKSFKAPQVAFSFSSDEFFYSKQSLSPLSGKVLYSKSMSSINVRAGERFLFNFNNHNQSPIYEIDGYTNNFDVSPVASAFLDVDYVDSFKIVTSSKFNVKLPKTKMESASGYVQLENLAITSGVNNIHIEKPISLFLTNGKLNFSAFSIKGTGGNLNFSSSANSTTPIDVKISGLFSLSFMHIFAPFLETMEGQTTINLKLQYGRGKSQMLGSAYIEDGYIKLAELQHAVESMKADILFNQDRIILNAINGKFASGTLVGDGVISFKGPKNLPMALNLYLDNINLNLPPQVNTQGNASLKLTGSWLPFLLSGEYNIFDGNITKEFSSSSETTLDSPYHIFLPQALRQKTISPIALDLQLLPKTPLAIKNSLLDGKIEGSIKVQGFPQQPALNGRVSLLRNSFINFKDVQFRVRDSNITFDGQYPPNPQLYIQANTTHKGYVIDMQVYGTASKPKFKLSSQPTLSEQEIISLLALGYTSDVNINNQTSNTTINTNSQNTFNQSNFNQSNLEVGTGLFSQNPLGKEFKDRFGFDVQFSSNFDTANSVAVPKVTVGYKINEKLSSAVTAQTGRNRAYDAKVRYEINKDIYGTAGITSQAQEEANQLRGNAQSDVIGIDLEYRKEFK